jgi:hypothetical protein
MHALSMLLSAAVGQLSTVSYGLTGLSVRLDDAAATDAAHKAEQQRAAQQALCERAARTGVLLLLTATGIVALRLGRLWEVHAVSW